MTVQFNDMIATIKRNENGFVIILGFKMANCNNKVTKYKVKYYNLVNINNSLTSWIKKDK